MANSSFFHLKMYTPSAEEKIKRRIASCDKHLLALSKDDHHWTSIYWLSAVCQELQQDKDIWDSLMSTSFKTKQASKTVNDDKLKAGSSLVAYWLGFGAFTALPVPGSVPGSIAAQGN